MGRFNRTLENRIVKLLYGNTHVNISYWGYAYKDFIMHVNFDGSNHDDSHGMSPYENGLVRNQISNNSLCYHLDL